MCSNPAKHGQPHIRWIPRRLELLIIRSCVCNRYMKQHKNVLRAAVCCVTESGVLIVVPTGSAYRVRVTLENYQRHMLRSDLLYLICTTINSPDCTLSFTLLTVYWHQIKCLALTQRQHFLPYNEYAEVRATLNRHASPYLCKFAYVTGWRPLTAIRLVVTTMTVCISVAAAAYRDERVWPQANDTFADKL